MLRGEISRIMAEMGKGDMADGEKTIDKKIRLLYR